jgi:hypothetical protein
MDRTLEFERVSVIEARWSFESEFRSPSREVVHGRAAPAEPASLDSGTLEWLAGIPDDVRPVDLAAQFPRIANEMFSRWRKVARCEEYFDDLLFDRRGGRMGFSRSIGRELTRLRDYYAIIHPERRSSWDFVA